MLDWTLLRSFLAVVETGSLSAAAATVGQSQPTLSRHIRELEATLGVILFTRSASGLEPTAAAQGLIDDARAMGAAADALALKARGRSQALSGTVRITASVMVANIWLPPILADLRRAEPNIQIEIVATDLTQSLLRRDADIAIRMVDPVERALVARKLGEAAVGLYGTRDYFARRGRVAAMQDLLAHDVIGFDRSETILDLYAAHGHPVTREAFPIRCDDQMVGWHLMLAGAGLGFAQALLADRFPVLERVPLDLLPPMPVWLVLHEEVRANPRIRRVADVLAAAITKLLRAG
ncbi:LysR family transcriptional regulator [Segnochrobactrum spirostomi]|uniref:LysR family transcriptional regulator n=1 Tax=Segnochrobactrum spirostomi TaxID=2608987 RepID=A0A6A7YBT9_9HYPH|nr:LysR family transcriptional regulator [Segnochrobactrum spirostomi]MQT15438.1 LysR family transcriptional regulator [Segnochrobactrum spirostomi]